MENVGWKIVALLAALGFTGGVGFSIYLHVLAHRIEMLLEEKGVPYRPDWPEGFSIRTRAYQAALFDAWCRQVIPDEPVLGRLRLVTRLQKWSAITFFVCAVMTARGCFRDR